MALPNAEDIIGFWFEKENRSKWFQSEESFDAAVADLFSPLLDAFETKRFKPWRQPAEGVLASILIFDQAPRNIYRDSPRAYAYDPLALALAKEAVDNGHDQALSQEQRLFVYLPLQHSENIADQERCCALVSALDEGEDWMDYAERHREIIARFGRFPHRNAVLGRVSTPEEVAFLEEPNSSF